MSNSKKEESQKVLFDTHYVKNNDFRTVFTSGIFGGVTPSGLINMNFFSDRAPIPKRITFEVDPKAGQLNNEVERDSKEGVVREVHFGMLIDINTAKSVVEWLNQKIAHLENLNKSENS